MSEDLIRRSDAIKAMEQRYQDILRIFKRKVKDGEKAIVLDMIGCIKSLPTIEPKRGEWIDDGFAHRCSECGKQGVGIEYFNFCPNCGAHMKTAENGRDYERAIEQMQHDMLYEPTYNPEDGSM